jgi:hypothetical protein
MTISNKILVKTRDAEIMNLSTVLCEIFANIHRNEQHIILDLFGGEGPAIENLTANVENNLIKLLEKIKEITNYDGRISIAHGNLIQDINVWPDLMFRYHDVGQLQGKDLSAITKINDLKTFGCMVGTSTYPRLLMSSFLNYHFKEKTFQTYRRSVFDPTDAFNFRTDRLMFEMSKGQKHEEYFTWISKFLPTTPVIKESKPLERLINKNNVWTEMPEYYANFFVDIVCETYFSGTTFFPTEKTMRPLKMRTPFIIHGPINYLDNLKKLGLKTFSNFWSEDYDLYEGIDRFEKIREILIHLGQMSSAELHKLYNNMTAIFDHNENVYQSLTPEKIMKKFA